jgi:hypothetical protein
LTAEIVWLTTYLTHAQPVFWDLLRESGVIAALAALMGGGDAAIRTPALRTIGNMVGCAVGKISTSDLVLFEF